MAPKHLRFNDTVDEYEERPSTPTLNQALRPEGYLSLDFSLPSAIFSADSRLHKAMMDTPACNPPLTEVTIRITHVNSPHGLCSFPVLHVPATEAVTVGDVLSGIREKLREPELQPSNDPAVLWYRDRRVLTVAQNADAKTRKATKNAEVAKGTLRVDRLLGNVEFAGIEVSSANGQWNVLLRPCHRYK